MLEQDLKRAIAKLPKSPGVYVFKGIRGEPLYIGKASRLKSRVSAYLKTGDPRLQAMVRTAKTISAIPTDSDIEALLTESKLIKEQQPKFNIMLRDDKQYFFVGFTLEDLPRIFLTHQPLKARGYQREAEYIGPLTDGAALKTVMRFLRNAFPYCTCKQRHHMPCLNSHIGKCLGFCCLKAPASPVQERRYRANIRAIQDVLNGKRQSLIRQMERRMRTLGTQQKLREALELQATIAKLKRIFENARIITRSGWQRTDTADQALAGLQKLLALRHAPARIEGYDISNISGQNATGSLVVFSRGTPDKQGYRLFNIRGSGAPDLPRRPPSPELQRGEPSHSRMSGVGEQAGDIAMLRQVLERRLAHAEWPPADLIIVDGGKAQLNAVRAAFSFQLGASRKERKRKANSYKLTAVPVIALTKDDRHRGDHIYATGLDGPVPLRRLPEPARNLILAVDAEAHRFAIKQYRRRHRQALTR